MRYRFAMFSPWKIYFPKVSEQAPLNPKLFFIPFHCAKLNRVFSENQNGAVATRLVTLTPVRDTGDLSDPAPLLTGEASSLSCAEYPGRVQGLVRGLVTRDMCTKMKLPQGRLFIISA